MPCSDEADCDNGTDHRRCCCWSLNRCSALLVVPRIPSRHCFECSNSAVMLMEILLQNLQGGFSTRASAGHSGVWTWSTDSLCFAMDRQELVPVAVLVTQFTRSLSHILKLGMRARTERRPRPCAAVSWPWLHSIESSSS